jgi:HSP20 family protein
MSNLIRWQRPDLSVWPTFGRLFGLHDELDRLLDNPLGELTRTSELLSVRNPALDVYEDDDNVIVKAELPGMKKEDIEVSLHNGALSIAGERKREEKLQDIETYRSERFVGRFHRSIALPSEVKADQVAANYKDGILTITLPKVEAAKPKQIEVKLN